MPTKERNLQTPSEEQIKRIARGPWPAHLGLTSTAAKHSGYNSMGDKGRKGIHPRRDSLDVPESRLSIHHEPLTEGPSYGGHPGWPRAPPHPTCNDPSAISPLDPFKTSDDLPGTSPTERHTQIGNRSTLCNEYNVMQRPATPHLQSCC